MKIFSVLAEFVLWELSIVFSLSLYSILVQHACNDHAWVDVGEGIVMAGDGRHDSMGHCAKYGAYTIFCCTLTKIIHFSLVQVGISLSQT